MRRGVWLGALALIGAVQSNLVAQPLVWKRVERPADPKPTVRASSQSSSAVMLDRPVARDSAVPRPFPDLYRQGTEISGYSSGHQVDRIPVMLPPGTIIAVSSPALAPVPMAIGSADQEENYRMGDQFASDRRIAAPRSDLKLIQAEQASVGPQPGSEPTKVGNWLKTFPVTPPAPGVFPADSVQEGENIPTKFYARAEYLLWWTKNDHTPPLVTTGSQTTQPGTRVDGAIGNADTVVLFGGTFQRNPFSGTRLTFGYALDECGDKFIEVSGFFLGPKSVNFIASSSQFPLLARPFFAVNSNLNQEQAEFVTRAGDAVGNVSVRSPSQLWGAQPTLVCRLCEDCDYRIDAIAGGRYLNLQESITIVEDIFNLPTFGSPFPNVRNQVTDRFSTLNQFYGGEAGVRGSWRYDRFTIGGQATIAMGVTHEQSSTNGFFTFPPGTPGVDPRGGGLLALPSNSGTFTRDRFAVVPEVGVQLGYDLTDGIRLSVGYNFLYWSSVMRPGDQIDRNIDVTQIPNFGLPAGTSPVTPARPMVLLKETDYWAQGLTVGIAFRY